MHDLERAPPRALPGEGARSDDLSGNCPREIGLRDVAVGGDRLVVGKGAADGDLGAVQRPHQRRVRPIEGRVAEVAIEREDGLLVRIDQRLEGVAA